MSQQATACLHQPWAGPYCEIRTALELTSSAFVVLVFVVIDINYIYVICCLMLIILMTLPLFQVWLHGHEEQQWRSHPAWILPPPLK